MKKIGILVDGSTTLTDKDFKRLDVKRIYFKVYNTKTNEEFLDADLDLDYIKKTHEQGIPFKTSCTPPGEVLDKFDEMLKEYESIIVFPMCKATSSQANNIKLYAEDYPGKIFIVEPKMMNSALDYCIERARQLEKENKTVEEIVNIINKESDDIGTVFTCQSWKTMAGSGRFHSLVGNILDKLGLCPLICLQYESPKFYGMCKNYNKSIDKMVNKFMKENDVESVDDLEIIALYDSLLEDKYKDLFVDYLSKKFNIDKKDIPIRLNPKAITIYTGINAYGITFRIKKRKSKDKKK